jgi:uncharacterized protein YkwD
MPATPTRRPFFLPRSLVRITAAAVVLAAVVLGAQKAPSAAIPQPPPSTPASILPTNVGIGLGSTRPISITFPQPMDAASLANSLLLYPEIAVRQSWSADARTVTVLPDTRWQTDERYLVVVPANARLANGSVLGGALRYAFTTQAAPRVTEFTVHRVGQREVRAALTRTVTNGETPPVMDTAAHASGQTRIGIRFSAAMNREDVKRAFAITPHVAGKLRWDGTLLQFTPIARLHPSARYAVTVVGAHDQHGNVLGGDTSFSFTVASRTRIVRVVPRDGSTNITGRHVRVWFSGAVKTAATSKAFGLYDRTAKHRVRGSLSWSADRARLTFTATHALGAGHRFLIRIANGAVDADGNSLASTFAFTTRTAPKPAPAPAATTRSAPAYVVPAPSGSASSYALSVINASRKAYGFAPLRLDSALAAVAQAHAVDQIRYGYFSHFSRDGSSFRDRFNAAGISWTHAGENQCYDYGSVMHAISWCHSIMMAEPYPGVWNHIANILDPNFTRVGFGYAQGSDGKLIMTWDFAG